MAVIEESQKEKAKELWLEGKKYKEISEITGIKESSIKSLASRYWKKEGLQPDKRKVATKSKVATVANAPPEVELQKEDIETLMNDDLTEKEQLFCIYYVRSFNTTSSYQKAYKCAYMTAAVNGSKLLKKAKIKAEIMRLKQERCQREMLTQEDIFQKWMDIAFADITDYLEFKQEEIIDDEGNTHLVNRLKFKDSTEVDGTLISEVKQGKDGASIKLPDRLKALQWLSDHMHFATEEQKAKLELLRAQKKKLESEDNTQDDTVQNKMDAISGIANQMKAPEDDDYVE